MVGLMARTTELATRITGPRTSCMTETSRWDTTSPVSSSLDVMVLEAWECWPAEGVALTRLSVADAAARGASNEVLLACPRGRAEELCLALAAGMPIRWCNALSCWWCNVKA